MCVCVHYSVHVCCTYLTQLITLPSCGNHARKEKSGF